ERLQLVVEAMLAGFKPRQVVAAPHEKLLDLLYRKEGETGKLVPRHQPPLPPLHDTLGRWASAALDFDESLLTSLIYDSWVELGPLGFVEQRVGPFLNFIGRSWSTGEFSIAAEHFVSSLLSDFLAAQWRRL